MLHHKKKVFFVSFKNFKIVSFINYSNSLTFLISLIFLYFFTSLTWISVGRNRVKIFNFFVVGGGRQKVLIKFIYNYIEKNKPFW